MNVLCKTYCSEFRQAPLEEVLRPKADGSGQIETIENRAEKNSKVIGRLLAALVEKKVLDLQEAVAMIDDYDIWEVKLLPDDPLTELGLDE